MQGQNKHSGHWPAPEGLKQHEGQVMSYFLSGHKFDVIAKIF